MGKIQSRNIRCQKEGDKNMYWKQKYAMSSPGPEKLAQMVASPLLGLEI